MRQFRSTITVAELRDLLDGQDDAMLVTFSSDYGDHSHTQQIHRLNGNAEVKAIQENAYSNSGWALMDDREDDGQGPFDPDGDKDDEDKPQQVLILS